MKIRKTVLSGKETNVFIYENKKEEYTVVAIPDLEWSNRISYTESSGEINSKLSSSLQRVLSEETEQLSQRIYQWTREM